MFRALFDLCLLFFAAVKWIMVTWFIRLLRSSNHDNQCIGKAGDEADDDMAVTAQILTDLTYFRALRTEKSRQHVMSWFLRKLRLYKMVINLCVRVCV